MLDHLRAALTAHAPREIEGPQHAAVLIPVIFDGGPPRILLTRRAQTLPTHKGQVAFPGGHIDPEDDGPVAAALRESWEEIGLPESAVEILGRLDGLPAIDGRTMVTPIVGIVREVPPLRPNPGEVDHIFTIPLAALAQPSNWRAETRAWRGKQIPVYFFPYFGELLWGLSAYFTLQLLDKTPLGAPLDGRAPR